MMFLRGRLVCRAAPPCPERQLLAAVVLLAVRDARAGKPAAAHWLDACWSDLAPVLDLAAADWRQGIKDSNQSLDRRRIL